MKLKSFQDNPAANAKPYSVTLAPIAIANGPIPPNAADIQHAQEILMICAKERSKILDGLNLMEFISQNPYRTSLSRLRLPTSSRRLSVIRPILICRQEDDQQDD